MDKLIELGKVSEETKGSKNILFQEIDPTTGVRNYKE